MSLRDIIATFTDPDKLWQEIEHIDPRLGAVIILVTTAAVGFVVLVIAANIFPEMMVAKARKPLFGGDGVVEKEGAPPIPPATEVTSLRVYPIKSCRGFELSSTRLRKAGLTLDRNWMFVSREDDNKFLTIRNDPSMTLIDTELVTQQDSSSTSGGGEQQEQLLRISLSGKPDKSVSIPAFPTRSWLEKNTKLTKVEIWEHETDAWEYGEEVNAIFCEHFGKPVSLVYKGPTPRMVGVNGSKELYGSETPHHFADVISLQIASEASIADLNKRLIAKGIVKDPAAADDDDADDTKPDAREFTIERFRPNIIVKGRADHPWEEDTWKRIRLTTRLDESKELYKLDLDVVARCARCQVPNVDPDTAVKHPREPWDELMKFRRIDAGKKSKWKPCFGMLCIPKAEGIVSVGAKLDVLETTDKHLYEEAKFSDL